MDTGPLSEVTSESAVAEAETMPGPNMGEKKVDPETGDLLDPNKPPRNPSNKDLGAEVTGSHR